MIYGSHINGWFIAIPNWEICTEAAHPSNTFYNTERLAKVLGGVDAAKAIAETIREHWEYIEQMREEQEEAEKGEEQIDEQKKSRGKKVR